MASLNMFVLLVKLCMKVLIITIGNTVELSGLSPDARTVAGEEFPDCSSLQW